MATELTLKDQSVIEIGKEIGDRVGEFQSAGTALVPANQMAPAGAVAAEVQPMNPFESMMTVLSDIRDGIYSLVDKFSEGVSLQDKALDQQEMAADAAALGETEAEIEAPGAGDEGDNRSFMEKAKDKVSGLMGQGGFMGLLIKGGLIAGLLLLAKGLQKYGKQIAEALTPIIDGLKRFFGVLTENIGPLFERAIDIIKTAFGGVIDIFKGLFSGDASLFFGGMKKIFLDLPIKLVSYVGEAFFGLIEAALAAFGIESEMVTNIKEWFRKLPENISAMFTAIGEFFTVTIPEKVIAIKDSVVAFFNDWIVEPFKNMFNAIGTFFTETIPNKITEIKDGIVEKFVAIKNWIIDMATAPFRKVKELMTNLLVGILESVEGLPFIGKKAKALKESLLGKGTTEVAEDIKTEGEQNVDMSNKMSETSGQKPNIQVDEDGNLLNPKDGAILKIPYAASGSEKMAKKMAGNVSAMGQGFFKPVYDDGGWFGMAHYRLQKIDGAGDGQDYSLSGPSIDPANVEASTPNTVGKNINTEGAEFVSSQNGGGGNTNVSTGGNVSSTTQNSVNQTIIADETMTGDRGMKDAIYT
jgi:hypothetical protein